MYYNCTDTIRMIINIMYDNNNVVIYFVILYIVFLGAAAHGFNPFPFTVYNPMLGKPTVFTVAPINTP